jgi:hypothetical protein
MLFAEYGTPAEWSVAGGTLLLALATYALAWGARKEVAISADHVVAIQRPLVTAVMARDVMIMVGPITREAQTPREPKIGLRNIGLGPAYNITGGLYWTGGRGGASALRRTTLGPGEDATTEVVGEGIVIEWENASGYVRYLDSAGEEWQTHFRFRNVPTADFEVEIVDIGKTSDLGEPRYSPEGRALS